MSWNLKAPLAVTFDYFSRIFVLCINYSFWFEYTKHDEIPSFQLINKAYMCTVGIVIIENWIQVRTRIHLSTITMVITHIQAVLSSRILEILAFYRKWDIKLQLYHRPRKLKKCPKVTANVPLTMCMYLWLLLYIFLLLFYFSSSWE